MEYKILNKISSPQDIKSLSVKELNLLCEEIRHQLIHTVSKTGGHLASNLGVVELTVAIHKAFNSPDDKILFDVGHQCYTHKLLTGRYDRFNTLRQEGGLSGFMRPDESEHDPFVTGHSSTSVSAALGIYKGNAILDNNNYTVSIVGDGAMTGGLIYEGLNNAGEGKNTSMIVILNDNKMSISRNVGALARYLTIMRSRPGYHRFKHGIKLFVSYIPLIGKLINRNLLRSKTMLKNAIYHSNIFEDMGFQYLGPVDGHDLGKLEQILSVAKEKKRPVLVHVLTRKGKGYDKAEASPNSYHGVSAFDVESGASSSAKADYSAHLGDELCTLATKDDKLCVITAAMTEGTGLAEFASRNKNRFFDVGIAEEHAVTFSAGLAASGVRPVFCVYSTFLQRGYDQLIHDVAIAGYNTTFCVDRAGIVGEDGETHQGLFDIAFLKTIPGMQIFSPTSYYELKRDLRRSLYEVNGPSAVRYPRGTQPALPDDFKPVNDDFSLYGDSSADTVIVTFGRIFAFAAQCCNTLKNEGVSLAVLKLDRIYPIEKEVYDTLLNFKNILIFEEGVRSGGINETICTGLALAGCKASISVYAVNDEFIPHMSTQRTLEKYNLDADSMCRIVRETKEVKNGK